MILLSRDENVDMQLYYPEKLSAHKKMIQEGVGNIMERNGLHFQSLHTDVLQSPKTISEVFRLSTFLKSLVYHQYPLESSNGATAYKRFH